MPNADFFARLGLFVVEDFFEPDLCARLRAEVRSAPRNQAEVARKGIDLIDETVRRTKQVTVPGWMVSLVKERLLALKPKVESHFHSVLTGCEMPQFLVYGPGDFFQQHRDSNPEPGRPEHQYLKDRRVSVVIFLNSEAQEASEDSYSGGSLTIYGLMVEPPWNRCGFPLVGIRGMLIAFPSQLTHEVTPVKCGERSTIVSWLA